MFKTEMDNDGIRYDGRVSVYTLRVFRDITIETERLFDEGRREALKEDSMLDVGWCQFGTTEEESRISKRKWNYAYRKNSILETEQKSCTETDDVDIMRLITLIVLDRKKS